MKIYNERAFFFLRSMFYEHNVNMHDMILHQVALCKVSRSAYACREWRGAPRLGLVMQVNEVVAGDVKACSDDGFGGQPECARPFADD